jgi:hypothetical protein
MKKIARLNSTPHVTRACIFIVLSVLEVTQRVAPTCTINTSLTWMATSMLPATHGPTGTIKPVVATAGAGGGRGAFSIGIPEKQCDQGRGPIKSITSITSITSINHINQSHQSITSITSCSQKHQRTRSKDRDQCNSVVQTCRFILESVRDTTSTSNMYNTSSRTCRGNNGTAWRWYFLPESNAPMPPNRNRLYWTNH